MKKIMSVMVLIFGVCVIPLTTHASEPNHKDKDKDASHRTPKTYIASVKTLGSIKHELQELAKTSRLYKFHEPLQLFDQILGELGAKASNDVYEPKINEIKNISVEIKKITKTLDEVADSGDAAKFKSNLSKLKTVLNKLDKYSSMSNEVRVKTNHNTPPTYRKLSTRMRGVYNALKDISNKGYLYKAHEDIEQINNATDALSQIFDVNIIGSIKSSLDGNLSTLKGFSETLHAAGDAEDQKIALSAFTKKVSGSIRKLEKLGEPNVVAKSDHHHH